jgi:four helix bundle protein
VFRNEKNPIEMKTFSFETLETWNLAKSLAVRIYKITRDFPQDEKFGITNQMRRAGVSIASNIAEGSARFSGTEQARFYEVAYGSTMELLNQLIISQELEFLPIATLAELRLEIEVITAKLTDLRKAALDRKQ